MEQSLDTSYKSLKNLVARMKAAGLLGFRQVWCSLDAPYGTVGDRETFNVTGTKIIVPPPFNEGAGGPADQARWYNDGLGFAININTDGTEDYPAGDWIDIIPQPYQYVEIEYVIFHRLTIRNNEELGGHPFPIMLWIFQDPQFIMQVNEYLERVQA